MALFEGYERREAKILATEEYVNIAIGNIESTLDAIITIQNNLIGGSSV